ncbi:unnamed protein product [[Actinomadura] parvosata subsp. kistnae]|nr:unnamed protein product [Actinomadura parvosata subsp. kistnae]
MIEELLDEQGGRRPDTQRTPMHRAELVIDGGLTSYCAPP